MRAVGGRWASRRSRVALLTTPLKFSLFSYSDLCQGHPPPRHEANMTGAQTSLCLTWRLGVSIWQSWGCVACLSYGPAWLGRTWGAQSLRVYLLHLLPTTKVDRHGSYHTGPAKGLADLFPESLGLASRTKLRRRRMAEHSSYRSRRASSGRVRDYG